MPATGISEGVSVKLVKCGVAMGLQRLGLVLAAAAFLIPTINPSCAEDRTISMYNIHTKDTINITFKRDGKFVPEALQALNHFMRDWRRDQEIKMDPALIDLMWELHHELGSKAPIHLICGFRSAGTNEMLRRTSGGQARNSRHITGQAADLVFPDVPLKQIRYSALVHERGGVGYYPASGLPFVHVDTGNVRHWPRMVRQELAMLFPSGHSLHVPSDGRPLTPADFRIARARAEANGLEKPWFLTHRQAGPMLASLVPDELPLLHRASLTVPAPALTQAIAAAAGRCFQGSGQACSPDQAGKPGSNSGRGSRTTAGRGRRGARGRHRVRAPARNFPARRKAAFLLGRAGWASPRAGFPKDRHADGAASVLASEEFDHRLQIEDLYEANSFRGRAVAFAERLRARMSASLNTNAKQASLR